MLSLYDQMPKSLTLDILILCFIFFKNFSELFTNQSLFECQHKTAKIECQHKLHTIFNLILYIG